MRLGVSRAIRHFIQRAITAHAALPTWPDWLRSAAKSQQARTLYSSSPMNVDTAWHVRETFV